MYISIRQRIYLLIFLDKNKSAIPSCQILAVEMMLTVAATLRRTHQHTTEPQSFMEDCLLFSRERISRALCAHKPIDFLFINTKDLLSNVNDKLYGEEVLGLHHPQIVVSIVRETGFQFCLDEIAQGPTC